MNEPFILDSHLDLALNALEWNRDLTRPISEIRAAESGLSDKAGRGCGTVCLPEMRRGGIGLAVVTQIAKVKAPGFSPVNVWQSPAQAWAMTQGQLAWYRAMEEAGEITMISGRADLDRHLVRWQDAADDSVDQLPIGCILSLEGADSLITLKHLERAHGRGLRAVGPAHYGPGIYAQGTESSGGFSARGRELLAEMQRLGMILDVTHLTDECFWEALKLYSGPIWASHHNCRALTPHQRQLADDQIRALIERDAVIGIALDGWMMVPDWVRGQTTPESRGLRLERAIEHVDHICQIAGNALHVGVGSDLDGGFGREQTPCDVETIADVRRLPELVRQRGGTAEDARNFAHGNFLRFLRRALR
ncbi:MAG TPA: membrane dipeptidase [Candidatus Baltobacteraceae bacterium]|jgi:membrane dipeptidase|nr:membrane dipeptidase [Candidatus Baltobacteraceae bacterium]